MTTEKPKGTVAVSTVLHQESRSSRPRRRSAKVKVPKVQLRNETFHVGYTGLSDRVYIYFDKRGRATLMNPQWKQVPFDAVRLSKRYHGAKNLQALAVGVKAREAVGQSGLFRRDLDELGNLYSIFGPRIVSCALLRAKETLFIILSQINSLESVPRNFGIDLFQYKLMAYLQEALEEACFAYGRKNWPG